ncbi:DUF3298 domain-containing protein [Romboutsia sp.]|uniref:DUF3298 and DUF4163 domain-containing protein n=1 Tax=Romboutsia sp. TaxID=1965302 RepID=UPI003F3EE6CB
MDNCIYNLIYIKFNQEFNNSNFFSYNLQYPSFYNFKNTYFYVNSVILNNLNSTIKLDVESFKEGLKKEEEEYNKSAIQNALPKRNYKVFSDYAVTFNKNHVLSVILSLMGFGGDFGPEYNDLYNYNIDLLTGNNIYLKDIFNKNINYIKVVSNYINYKISQNKDLYYKDVVIEIPEDQAFYITDDGIVIYFGLDELSPSKMGIPKFKMSFSRFAPYINPRFYCDSTNVVYEDSLKRSKQLKK